MEKMVRFLFAVILSVLVLLGSGGFTVGKMICMGDGHATYSLGKAKDCCERNGVPIQSVKHTCCDLVNISYSLDHFSPSSKISSAVAQTPVVASVFAFKLQTSDFRLLTFPSDIPPPDIKARLYSFRSLLL